VPAGAVTRHDGGLFPPTYRQVRAAGALAGLLEEHAEAEAITWQVLPSGSLAGRISVRGPGRDGRALFGSWVRAIRLREVATAPAGRGTLAVAGVCASVTAVSVTLTAVLPARRPDARGEAAAVRRGRQPDIIHQLPDPGRRRPGGTLLPPAAGPGSPHAASRSAPRMRAWPPAREAGPPRSGGAGTLAGRPPSARCTPGSGSPRTW
jgi:hypothetical protein